MYLITMEKWAEMGGNIIRKLYMYVPLIDSAHAPSKVAPKQSHLATTIASPSTTLAPTPCRQRLIAVDGWCDTITHPFPSRFSSTRFCFQVFVWPKTLGWQNLVFWAQTQQQAPLGPLKPSIPRSKLRARAHTPIEHRQSSD
jgi:hypothetical protein